MTSFLLHQTSGLVSSAYVERDRGLRVELERIIRSIIYAPLVSFFFLHGRFHSAVNLHTTNFRIVRKTKTTNCFNCDLWVVCDNYARVISHSDLMDFGCNDFTMSCTLSFLAFRSTLLSVVNIAVTQFYQFYSKLKRLTLFIQYINYGVILLIN